MTQAVALTISSRMSDLTVLTEKPRSYALTVGEKTWVFNHIRVRVGYRTYFWMARCDATDESFISATLAEAAARARLR